jgi:hypothetical protein
MTMMVVWHWYEKFKGSEGAAGHRRRWVWAPRSAMIWSGRWEDCPAPNPGTPEDGADPLYGAPLGD